MQGFFLGFPWIHLDFLGLNSRADCIRGLMALGKFQTPVTRLSIRSGKSRKRWPVA